MLEGVEAEIGLAGGVRVAVNGDDATFFAELGVCGIPGPKNGTWGTRDSGQWSVISGQLPGGVCDALDALIEQPAHAVTSSWRMASRAEAQGLQKVASGAEMKGSPSTVISRRAPPVAPMRATRKL